MAKKKSSAYYATNPLQPLSLRAKLNMSKRRTPPRRMERVYLEREQSEAVERTALGVFSDCVNIGLTFQEALSAVYLSGVDHALSARKEQEPTS